MHVGDKVFDLEEGVWGIVWKITRQPLGSVCLIQWSDGFLDRVYSEMVEEYKSLGLLADDQE